MSPRHVDLRRPLNLQNSLNQLGMLCDFTYVKNRVAGAKWIDLLGKNTGTFNNLAATNPPSVGHSSVPPGGQGSYNFLASSPSSVTIANQLVGTGYSYTVTAWVRSVRNSSNQAIWDNRNGAVLGRGGVLYISNLRTLTGFIQGSSSSSIVGGVILTDNVWWFVAVTYGLVSGRQIVYVNGFLDNQTSPGYGMSGVTGAANAAIGVAYDGSSGFNGSIDRLRIYPVELTASQILTLYSLQSSGSAQLTNYTDPYGPDYARASPNYFGEGSVVVAHQVDPRFFIPLEVY